MLAAMLSVSLALPCISWADVANEPTKLDKPKFKAPRPEVEIVDDALMVTWDKVPGAKKYKVYRSYKRHGKKVLLKKTKSRKFRDKTVKSGKRAYYFIKAYNGKKWTKFTKPRSGRIYRVYIDAGHGKGKTGGFDPGCSWGSYREYKLVTPIAAAMAKSLQKNDVYVYTDAFDGNNKSIPDAIRFIKKHSVSAFVLIHCDYAPAPSGTLPLYRTAEQKELARALNKGVHSKVKIKDRGLCRRTDLMSLNTNVGAPACLYEVGAIRADNKVIRTQYKRYGKGLAKGVCNYLGIEYKQ